MISVIHVVDNKVNEVQYSLESKQTEGSLTIKYLYCNIIMWSCVIKSYERFHLPGKLCPLPSAIRSAT